jgi:hypothetical protein
VAKAATVLAIVPGIRRMARNPFGRPAPATCKCNYLIPVFSVTVV